MKKLIKLFILLTLFTTSLTAQSFTREIKVAKPRINGSDVIQLQRTLLTLGFEDVGDVDGYFGPMSSTALKKYQGLAGFEQTGVFTKANFDFLYSNSFLNQQFNYAVEKFNLLTKSNAWFSYSVVLDEDSYHASEGAGMDIYKDGDKIIYAVTSIYGGSGNFKAYFIPLGSGDYLFVQETNYYDSNMGTVVSSSYNNYICISGKLYNLDSGKFIPETENSLGITLRDLKNTVKN